MKIRRKILITFSTLLATILACAALILFIPKGNSKVSACAAELILSEQTEIKEVYATGTLFEVPSAQISYGGTTYNADSKAVLFFPNGSAYEGSSFTLSQAGKYTLTYSTKVGDAVVTADKTFRVEHLPYTVPSSSSVQYVEKLATQNSNQEISNGGVRVKLGMNAKFEYNNVIDLSNSTAETPFLTFSPYQYTQYMLDENDRPVNEAKEIFVRLTDAYDSANYVDVYMLDRANMATQAKFFRPYPYFSAGAVGQTMYGLDTNLGRLDVTTNGGKGNGKIVTVNGKQYCAVYENFGINYGSAPAGERYYEVVTDTTSPVVDYADGTGGHISLYYDYKDNAVYASSPTKDGNKVVDKSFLVCDFDDTGLYSNPFKGFTTGEVYLSMWAGSYLSDSFSYEISEIYGVKGTNLAENVNVVKDDRAPVIQFEKAIPEVIYTEKMDSISIIPATVYDVNGLGEPNISVWYNYGFESAEWVNVVDEKFVPTKIGTYTVEYLAEDKYGNQAIEMIRYASIDDEVLSFDVKKVADNISAGSWLRFEQGEGQSTNGVIEVRLFITEPSGNKIELSADDVLLVEYAGTYTVEYQYTDGFTSSVFNYQFTANSSDLVNIATPILPEYFIKGASYTLDAVDASIYTGTSPKYVATEVFISEDGADYKKINYADFKVKANSNIRFKYVYEDTAIFSEEIEVVDVGFEGANTIDKSKYFVGDVSSEATKEGIVYTSKSEDDVTELTFVNVLSFDSFYFEFIVFENAGFDRLEIILTDYYERDNTLTFEYGNLGTSTSFGFLDYSTEIAKSFEDTRFSVAYEASSKQISERNGKTYDYTPVFSTDRILLKVRLHGTEKDQSKIMVSYVGNQYLNNNTKDRTSAYVSYKNLFGGVNSPNSVATIYAMDAIDVLTPYLANNATVSVSLSNGDFATSVDGIVLNGAPATRDYQIQLTTLGKYLVQYSYLDQKNNATEMNYTILCADDKKPTLTLDNEFSDKTIQKVKVGSTVKVVGYKATDDRTAEQDLKIITYVLKENGDFVAVTDGTFFADKVGNYIVYYYCYDEANNYTIAQYRIRAEEEK